MPFLGSIPLDPAVREGGDDGLPTVLGDGETAAAFRRVTERTMDNVGHLRRREANQ